MDRCLLHAHGSDLCVVVTDTRVKEPGSATDAKVDIEMPPGHVLGGMNEAAPNRPMDHPIPTVTSIPSYASVSNGKLVRASCVPKLKLSSPRARLIFSQGGVVALPLTLDSLP